MVYSTYTLLEELKYKMRTFPCPSYAIVINLKYILSKNKKNTRYYTDLYMFAFTIEILEVH